MKKKNILITGTKGFIGSTICKHFKKKKIKFRELKINQIEKSHKNISHLLHLQFFISKNTSKNFQKKNLNIIKKEYKKLFFLGFMGCGVCGAFPFLAGETTTVTNMGIIYTSSPIFIILISSIFFNEKINITKVVGLISCLIGVFAIIIKGDLYLLINLNFNIGDLWMLAAAIGWALYSIYLFYWKTKLKIFQRFTLISFFGAVSLLPFYVGEEIFFEKTFFNEEFFMWVIFAAISPGIIAFTLYTIAQKKLGASLTGFTLYIFTIYGAIYGYFLFEEKLENYHLIGTVLVFIGVYLAKKKNVQKI